MALVEMHVNRPLMLMDCFGPEILFALWIKGQVLHRESVHLRVAEWLSDFSAFLTRKLLIFGTLCKIRMEEEKMFRWSQSRFVEC